MPRTAIGVDIGGTRLRAARVAEDGTILALAKTASSPDPQTVLERIESLIGQPVYRRLPSAGYRCSQHR